MKNHTIKFELTEAQYQTIKAALNSSQKNIQREVAITSELLEKEETGGAPSERLVRNYDSTIRNLGNHYEKNWGVQQTMAKQSWTSYDEKNF